MVTIQLWTLGIRFFFFFLLSSSRPKPPLATELKTTLSLMMDWWNRGEKLVEKIANRVMKWWTIIVKKNGGKGKKIMPTRPSSEVLLPESFLLWPGFPHMAVPCPGFWPSLYYESKMNAHIENILRPRFNSWLKYVMYILVVSQYKIRNLSKIKDSIFLNLCTAIYLKCSSYLIIVLFRVRVWPAQFCTCGQDEFTRSEEKTHTLVFESGASYNGLAPVMRVCQRTGTVRHAFCDMFAGVLNSMFIQNITQCTCRFALCNFQPKTTVQTVVITCF